MNLDALLAEVGGRLETLPPGAVEELRAAARRELVHVWTASPGPQRRAYDSPADVLLYGGQGGGGKSSLLAGTALTAHRRSLLIRRKYTDLGALIEEVLRFYGSREGFNGSTPPRLRARIGDLDRLVDFGAAAHLGDEQSWQGQPHDFLGIDEATQLLEMQVRFFMGWLRPGPGVPIDQRCRAILATNPPLTAEGQWIIGMFRPWLDLTHPKPARPGELRWFVTAPDGKDLEVDGPEPVTLEGKVLIPQSRTFIPAALADNPFLKGTKYQAQLDALPEPIRSAVRDGNFMATRKDAAFQVIPTAWVLAAEQRWKPEGFKDFGMTAMALDPAGGGRDSAELAWRHGGWYAPLVSAQGEETADGSKTAGTLIAHRRDNAPVVIDVGGGYGGSVTLRLKDNGIAHVAFNGSAGSSGHPRDTAKLKFVNKRAEAWWRFREELDPDQEGGSCIALPPDPELRADLTAPTYEVRSNGILIEGKDELRKRLGRSPGKGDAVVMCLSEGSAAVRRALNGSGAAPKVIMGHAAKRRSVGR